MLRVSTEAHADLREAAEWYQSQQSGLGEKFLNEIDRIFDRIEAAPRQFPVVYRDLRRALPSRFPYAVYFDADRQADIIVVAILHQRRDRSLLDERNRQ